MAERRVPAATLPTRSLLAWFCRRNAWWLAGGAAAGIAWRLAIFAIPLFVGLAVDRGLQQEDFGTTALWAAARFGTACLIAVFDACRHWCADVGYYTRWLTCEHACSGTC